jgi:hypothetical protein
MADVLCEQVLKYAEQIERDFALTEVAIGNVSKKVPGLKCKWFGIQMAEEKKLDRLKEERKKAIEEYTEQFGDRGKLKFKVQREAESDKRIVVMDKRIAQQKEIVRFLDKVVREIVCGIGWSISNAIKIMQIESM